MFGACRIEAAVAGSRGSNRFSQYEFEEEVPILL